MTNYYQTFQPVTPDPILGLVSEFKKDNRKDKLNLTIGVYKSEASEIVVFNSVHQAEKILWEQKNNKGYPPIDGEAPFKEELLKIITLNPDPQHFYLAHTVGATSALRLAGELMKKMGIENVLFSDLTWPNHPHVFAAAGLKPIPFKYYNEQQHTLEIENIYSTLENAPAKSAVLFQVSCHNPTGRDPNFEQWQRITEVIKRKELFLVLDCAYQGFGDGLEEDMAPYQLFLQELDQVFLCYSCAKNFGLYGERVGAFIAYDKQKRSLENLGQNARKLIRSNYSTPPIHGARIVKTILQSSDLKQMWMNELKEMRFRLRHLRQLFSKSLHDHKVFQNSSYLIEDKGLFSLLELSTKQVVQLRKTFGIYLVENGRVNIAALNQQNIEHITLTLKKVLAQNA